MAKKAPVKKSAAKKSVAKKAPAKKSQPKSTKKPAVKKIDVREMQSEVTKTIRVTLKNVRIGHEEETKGKLVGMYMLNQLDEGNPINVTIADGQYVGIATVRSEDTEKQKFIFIEFSVQQFIG